MLPTLPTIHNAAAVDELAQPLRGVSSAAQLLDVLSDFAPGQKLVALIQAQLPNGAYRAAIGQRDVTLALPFSARPGDSLELKVVEHKGKVAFAVTTAQVEAADQENVSADAGRTTSAVSARLSQAGQTIAHLLSGDDADSPAAAPLNAGRPVLPAPSADGDVIAPALREAVANSGLFYESHLAQWTTGHRDAGRLAAEPQALFAGPPLQNSSGVAAAPAPPPPPAPAPAEAETPALIREHFGMRPPRAPATAASPTSRPAEASGAATALADDSGDATTPIGAPRVPAGPGTPSDQRAPAPPGGSTASPLPQQRPLANASATGTLAAEVASEAALPLSVGIEGDSPAAAPAAPKPATAAVDEREPAIRNAGAGSEGSGLPSTPARAGGLPGELAPLVQQQLLSLANHQYPFHGALWPGQKIEWEIVDEEGKRSHDQEDGAPRQWKTRLKLLLPSLGGIDATIELDATDVRVRMDTSADTEARLRAKVEVLGERLADAGLRLTAVDFKSAAGNLPPMP